MATPKDNSMNEITQNEVYAVFAGMIDQAAVTRIFNGMTGATTAVALGFIYFSNRPGHRKRWYLSL